MPLSQPIFNITTTGATSPIVLNDLGARTFTHPTTNYNLASEYTLDDIRNSLDIANALDNGDITATLNGVSITTSEDLESAYILTSDDRLFTQNVLLVKQNPGKGEFSSVKDAVDSIVGNSASNRFLIKVGPGIYTENTITCKSFVSITGETSTSVVIQPSNPNNDIFVINSSTCRIESISIQNATGVGAAGVRVTSSPNPSNLHKINITNCYEHIVIETNATAALLGVTQSLNTSGAATVRFVRVEATGGQITNYRQFNGLFRQLASSINFDNAILVTGTGARVDLNGGLAEGTSNMGDGLVIQDGGFATSSSGFLFDSFDNAIILPNVGVAAALSIKVQGIFALNNNMDIVVDHPGATGSILGIDDYNKISLDPSSTVQVVGKDLNIINVSKRGGDFNTIEDALNAITTNTQSNSFVIHVGPGTFVENQLVGKEYVAVISENATIEAFDPSVPLIIGADGFSITGFNLTGVTDPGVPTIYYESSGNALGQIFTVNNCVFQECDTLMEIKGSLFPTTSYVRNCFAGGIDPFDTGFKVSDTGAGLTQLILNSFGYQNLLGPFPSKMVTCSGSGASVNMVSGLFRNSVPSGTMFEVQDGGLLRITSSIFSGFDTLMHSVNSGAAPEIEMTFVQIENSGTYDANIEHPGTYGTINGSMDSDKISINPSSSISLFFTDPVNSGIVASDLIKIRFTDGTVTDVSTLFLESSTTGCLEGGALTDGGGFVVNVAAGFGYHEQLPDNDVVIRRDWTNTSITLAADQDVYIYFNNSGVLTSNGSRPDGIFNIILGRIVTNGTGIELIDLSPMNAEHTSNRFSELFRDAIGSIYASGSIVEENVTPFHLDVGSGKYFYASNVFTPSGGTDITFTPLLGGLIQTPTNVVNNTQYDVAGVLTSIPAGEFVKHSLYVVGEDANEKYYLIYATDTYTNLLDVQNANIPTKPSWLKDSAVLIAGIIIEEGNTNIVQIRDLRPVIGFKSEGVNASADHLSLLNLTTGNAGHTQFLMLDGSTPMVGDLDLNANNIVDVDNIDLLSINSLGIANYFKAGGNNIGGNTSIGLSDNFSLDIKTNNLARIAISNTGVITIGNLSGTGTRMISASATGVLSTPTSPANTWIGNNTGSSGFATDNVAAALTKVDDTNITLTLGGTPATALLNAVSLTLGWTGTLSGTRGGTGVNNGSNTITLSGNLTTTGSFNTIFAQQFSGTITLPNATSTLATLALVENLTNKTLDNTNTITLKDNLFTLQDNSDTSKQLQLELSEISTATTRTLTAADYNGVIVAKDGVYKNTTTTTNNTVTTIATIATASNTTYHLETTVISKKTSGGGTGSVGDSSSYIRTSTIKNVSGTLTIIGTASTYTMEDITSHNVTITTSGTNILVQVTGSTSNNVDWVAITEIIKL